MNAQETFVAFLEEHPGYYLVSQSDVYVNLLLAIEKEAMDLPTMNSRFPNIDFSDLELMVKSLVLLKLVGVLKTNDKTIYFITKNAKEFLSRYNRTKAGFGNV